MWTALMWILVLVGLVWGALWAVGRGLRERCSEEKIKLFVEDFMEEMESRLDEVEKMRESGEITEEECETLREKITSGSDRWWGLDPEGELDEVEQMRKSGKITEEEYRALRKKILTGVG